MSINDLFYDAKTKVNLEDAYEMYTGIPVVRGKAVCAFHSDTHPSLSFKRMDDDVQIFKCFSCGECGDVFKLLKLTLDLKGIQALRRLNEDFRLGYDLDQKRGIKMSPQMKLALKQEQEAFVADRQRKKDKERAVELEYRRLCGELHKLEESCRKLEIEQSTMNLEELKENYDLLDQTFDLLIKIENKNKEIDEILKKMSKKKEK